MNLALLQILPIFVGIVSSFVLPYGSLLLSPWAVSLLFVLMYLAGLNIDFLQTRWSKTELKVLAKIYFIGFIFFPLIQWALVHFLVKDAHFRTGLIWASLCPIAIVAPLFCKEDRGDARMSMQLLILSMILFPIVSPLMLWLLSPQSLQIPIWPLFKDGLLLVVLPLALAYITRKFTPIGKSVRFFSISKSVSLTIIGILSYIFLGVASLKITPADLRPLELITILGLALCQDFLPLFLGKRIFQSLNLSEAQAQAASISLAMKNVAISGAILLVFAPKSTLGSSTVFIAHCGLFLYLNLRSLKNPKS